MRTDGTQERGGEAGHIPTPCNCVDLYNQALQENEELCGIYIRTTTSLRTGVRKPIIAAERREGKGRKVPPIIPAFCPFCGTKYGE